MVSENAYKRFTVDATAEQTNKAIIAVSSSSAYEGGEGLDRYNVKVDTIDTWDQFLQERTEGRSEYIVDGVPLLLRLLWQETVETPIIPEKVAKIPTGELEPEPVDDLDWLLSNISELRDQYAGQWVAIAQGQVVASASSVPKLKEEIETTGIERPLVTFISEQEPNWNMAYGSQGL